MKKTFLSILFCSLLVVGAKAQTQGLYFDAGFGYGFRAGSTIAGTNDNPDGSERIVKASYGVGITPNVSIGYILPNNMGFELGAGFLFGKKTVTDDEFGNSRGNTEYMARCFYLNPSFIVKGNDELRVVPYAKVGLFLGLGTGATNMTHVERYAPSGQITGMDDTEVKYKGHVATGLTSAFGLDWMFSEKFAVFTELNGRLASWAPGSYTSTNTSVDYVGGVAQPQTVTSVSGNFIKEIPANYSGTDVASQILPFSAIGFNVGVKWYLSK